LVAAQDHPKVTLEQWNFLERVFHIPLKERTWKQLITLDTLHWCCKGPQPTDVACHYNEIARKRESVVYFYYFLFFVFLNNSCLTLSSHSLWCRNGRR